MEQSKTNLCIFIGFCFLIYLVNKFLNYNENNLSYIEGMTTDGSNNVPTSTTNGVAGNAASYAAQIKAAAVKIEDQLLIPKYRSDYENVILNLDELVNDLMLQTALNVNLKNPLPTIAQLSQLQDAKTGLNSIMKYVDSSK